MTLIEFLSAEIIFSIFMFSFKFEKLKKNYRNAYNFYSISNFERILLIRKVRGFIKNTIF